MSNQQQSYTIWSPHDTVRDVAESLGLENISEEVLKALAMDVEYRILEIIEQAIKFKRHSKTDILTTEDVSKALRVLNVEPLYGYHDNSSLNKDVKFKKVNVPGGQSVYYLDEEEVDFDKLINQPLPHVPRLPTFTTHWLAIEGVQPAIQQNPNLNEIRATIPPVIRGAIVTSLNENSIQIASSSSNGTETGEAGGGSRPLSLVKPGQNTEVRPLVKHILSKELQIYFDKVIGALFHRADETTSEPNSGAVTHNLDGTGGTVQRSAPSNQPPTEEELEEQQRLKNAALTSLKSDTGFHQLVPYFIQFIAEQITHNLSNLELLTTVLEMIYALLNNPSIFLDPYIHSLMPSILTLLLAKKLGGIPPSDSPEEIHDFLEKTNALRNFAASLLDYVLKKFPEVYKSLKLRVTRTLLKTFLDTNRVFGTYYGCLKGVTVLETEAIRFFLGNLHNWAKLSFNEPNITIDEYQQNTTFNNNRTKFTDEELRCLVDTIVEVICVLKQDLPDMYSGRDEKEVTPEERTKLASRVGLTVAGEILKRDDAKEIICAIFFGE